MTHWTSEAGCARPVAGIDLGGTKVRAAIADADGHIRAEVTEPTDLSGGRGVLTQIARIIREMESTSSLRAEQVGVGSPGVVDATGRFQLSFNIDDLAALSLATELHDLVGVPVTVENDVNAAALGEQWQGLGRGRQDFVVLSIGTGLGMGIVINGALYRGARGFAGEVAYLPLGADPRTDASRRFGALETAAGTAGIRRQLTNALSLAGPGALNDLTASSDVQQIFAAARAGNAIASRVVSNEASLLAVAVLAIAAVIDPELVIVTGGIGADPLLIAELRSELAAISPHDIRVERSTLGDRCGVIGALATARMACRATTASPETTNSTIERKAHG